MKIIYAFPVVVVACTSAFAGGIERSGHPVSILFEDGNHMELTFGSISPSVSSVAGGISDATRSYQQLGVGVKMQITDDLSVALIYDQPYGAQIRYSDGPFIGGFADISSSSLSLLGRYEFENGFSVHGGLRTQTISGSIASIGLLDASSDVGLGGVFGVAYERPDIALRVALTYFDGISNSFTGTENFAPVTPFEVSLPESINLDFQTGIAEDTLLFGSIRHVSWSGVNLTTGLGNYVSFDEDTTTYNLGIGRRLNENWSIAATLGYESGTGKAPTLGPTSGYRSFGIGGTWTEGNTKVSMGVRYVELGDALVSAENIPFTDNTSWAAGAKIGWSF